MRFKVYSPEWDAITLRQRRCKIVQLNKITMKKLIFALLIVSFLAAMFTSCSSSRRSLTGCPMTENIIH